MAINEEKKNVTGLDMAADRKEAEYDLVKALLEASSFKTAEENITEVTIARNGKFLFEVRVHPLSDADVKFAQKKAGIFKPNPNNKKLGQVKVDTDAGVLGSWLIYLATVEADQEKIWGNNAIMQKFNLQQPWQSIDCLLMTGEKSKLVDTILEISGMNDDEEEQMDEEEFQSASD